MIDQILHVLLSFLISSGLINCSTVSIMIACQKSNRRDNFFLAIQPSFIEETACHSSFCFLVYFAFLNTNSTYTKYKC